jgi:hypothetical protein
MKWGAADPAERGPVLATVRHMTQRNSIGAHSGGCVLFLGLVGAPLPPCRFIRVTWMELSGLSVS